MPYSNIVFVKFRVELLQDYRFMEQLDDQQKLIYLGLLLLAGTTKNSIPHDVSYLKRVLNLKMELENIENGLKKIKEIYPKMLITNGLIHFKNFEEIHNYMVGKKIGNPKIEIGIAQNKNKNKKKKKNKEEEQETTSMAELFYLKYQNTFGHKYVADFGKDGMIFKNLSKTVSITDLPALLDKFFGSSDPFIQKAGYTVGVFKSQINKLRSDKMEAVPESLRKYIKKE